MLATQLLAAIQEQIDAQGLFSTARMANGIEWLEVYLDRPSSKNHYNRIAELALFEGGLTAIYYDLPDGRPVLGDRYISYTDPDFIQRAVTPFIGIKSSPQSFTKGD